MKSILDKLKVDETFTKPKIVKQKKFNKVKNNIPLIEDYNFMADLVEMPETKNNYKYLFVMVDLATDEFDIEPLKTKTPQEVVNAMLKMFKRKYISKPYASIATDGGSEFKGVFHKWLYDNNIFHKESMPNRHTQMANVEALNGQLVRLFNGYMNMKEEKTNKPYKNWDDIIDFVRKELNKVRKKKLKPYDINNYPLPDITKTNKFNVGDIVNYKLDWAENALGNKQPTPNFRIGDYKFSRIPKKIVSVLYFNDEPYYRYLLEGMPKVSFSEFQLMKAKGTETETKYKVKKLIDKRVVKKEIQYLVWWDKYKKSESTWEPEKQLIKDGLKAVIDEYNKNN